MCPGRGVRVEKRFRSGEGVGVAAELLSALFALADSKEPADLYVIVPKGFAVHT